MHDLRILDAQNNRLDIKNPVVKASKYRKITSNLSSLFEYKISNSNSTPKSLHKMLFLRKFNKKVIFTQKNIFSRKT